MYYYVVSMFLSRAIFAGGGKKNPPFLVKQRQAHILTRPTKKKSERGKRLVYSDEEAASSGMGLAHLNQWSV